MTVNKDIFIAKQAAARRLEQLSATTFYAVVSAVDEKARTCTVKVDDAPYTDVLLYAIVDDSIKGLCLVPAIDSRVLVSRIGGSNELYVSMFSELDKVLLTIGDKVTLKIADGKVEVDADKIVFNGGDNKGLVKIEQLTAKVNAFVDAFNNHVHSGVIIGVSGGSGAPAVGAPGNSAAPTAPAQKLNKTDYENDKITH